MSRCYLRTYAHLLAVHAQLLRVADAVVARNRSDGAMCS
jgi:hypothetical protein